MGSYFVPIRLNGDFDVQAPRNDCHPRRSCCRDPCGTCCGRTALRDRSRQSPDCACRGSRPSVLQAGAQRCKELHLRSRHLPPGTILRRHDHHDSRWVDLYFGAGGLGRLLQRRIPPKLQQRSRRGRVDLDQRIFALPRLGLGLHLWMACSTSETQQIIDLGTAL
jgi:hypothetical protein